MRLSPAPVRSRTRGARTGTGPRPVMIARSVSIRSRSTILSLVIVISGIRFKLRNSNPNRRPAVTAPGVRYAREGFAHALSGSVLHHAQGRHALFSPEACSDLSLLPCLYGGFGARISFENEWSSPSCPRSRFNPRDLHLVRIVCKVGRVRSLLNDVGEALPRIMGADD